MQAQKNIPTAVIQAFNKQYIGVTEIEWEQEDETEFEVNFVFKGVEYTANYDDKGNWLETEHELNYMQLPELIRLTIESKENKNLIQDIAKIETAKGEIYFEVTFKDMLQTIKEKFYKSNGTEITR